MLRNEATREANKTFLNFPGRARRVPIESRLDQSVSIRQLGWRGGNMGYGRNMYSAAIVLSGISEDIWHLIAPI